MSTSLDLRSDLPWLHDAQAQLRSAISRDRMPHALLVQGSTGIGAAWFAQWVAALLLCESKTEQPCGQCRSCQRVLLRQHPDYQWLEPIEDSREIRVDQIRELLAELSLTSHGNGWKVVVLAPADRLNRNAANALLKTLEEPSARTLLVLVAAQPSKLPATIRSRCQRITLSVPTAAQADDWLQARGADAALRRVRAALALEPLQALQIDTAAAVAAVDETARTLGDALTGQLDVVATAERWGRKDENYEWRLTCIETWLTDQARQSVEQAAPSANLRAAAHLPAGVQALNIRALLELIDGVRDLRRLADAPLNRSLGIERLLWRMPAVAGRKAAGA